MDIAKYVERRAKKAGGMEHLSRETGVSRPMLYRMLGPCNPTMKQLLKMGLKVVETKDKA
jgi:DNA-binding phage protein